MKDFGKRIAVMILGPLGDVINTSPVFKILREAYPSADLSIITIDRGAPAVKGIPQINNVYVLDRSKVGFRKNIDAFKFAWQLRGKFDTVVVLDNSLRSAICAFLTLAKHRVGRGLQMRELFLTDIVPYLKEEKFCRIHVSEHYARCLKPLNLYRENVDTFFEYTKEDDENVKKLLEECGLSGKKIVGFCPACRLERKNLRIEDSAEIIKRLNSCDKYKVIIVGGSDIKEYVNTLCEFKDIEFIDFSGKTAFTQTAALIDKCEKFISVDTACMHIAFARKTPTMAVFFNELAVKWGPKNLKINNSYTNLNNKEIPLNDFWKSFLDLPEKSSLF
ncbi:glycosyltransferase family 9 protein [bacterium]|nr:glycosyltransferase family 9 protein [bacterium]